MMKALPAIISQALGTTGGTLAFRALVPDVAGGTYEMLGVETGTGSLSSTHTSDLYSADNEGVYRRYFSNGAVWEGGRSVMNQIANSNRPDLWNDNAGATLVGGKLDPYGGNTAFEFTAGQTNSRVNNKPTWGTLRRRYTTIWIRRVSGTGTIAIYGSNSSTGSIANVTSAVDGQWRRFVTRTFTPGSSTINCGIRLSVAGDVIEFAFAGSHESDLPDNTIPIPDEYVETGSEPIAAMFANENGNSTHSGTTTYAEVTEAVGTPLAESPYLQYYPAAQNDLTYSREPLQWAYQQASQTITFDQVGLDGSPNTASLVDKTISGTGTGAAISGLSGSTVLKAWIKKDTDQSRFPLLQLKNLGGAFINTQTGHAWAVSSGVTTDFEVIDSGDWWLLLVETTDSATELRFWAAGQSTEDSANVITSATGSCIVGNVEFHLNKSLSEVRGLGPIFTEASSVATDDTIYFANGNEGALESSWYEEIEWPVLTDTSEMVGATNHYFLNTVNALSVHSTNRPMRLRLVSPIRLEGVSGASPVLDGALPKNTKVASVYSDNDSSSAVNVDGVWGADGGAPVITITGLLIGGGVSPIHPAKFRNLQRYDITSYQQGKDIIDDLMNPPVFAGGNIIDQTVEDES